MIQIFLTFLALLFLPIFQARAQCPLCTIAVGLGVGLSRWLGIDDLISGAWIGGLITSMVLWFLNWLKKRGIQFKFLWLIVFAFSYSIFIIPLYLTGIMGHPLNKFLGIDRLLFGIIFGALAFIISFLLHNFLRKKNQGKVYFPFQKVVIPILFLLLASFILYLIR